MLVFICLYLLTKIDLSASQFNDHIDLQKISEIIFQNEKYNVLKPTIHIVKDHFVEFIQKRHNYDTSERIFLDRNGFRHIWKGLEIPRQMSSRNADISEESVDSKNNKENTIDTSTVNNKISSKDSKTKAEIIIKPDIRRTVVKTTFFCPFFGLVRMSTNVKKFDEVAVNGTR